MSSTPPTYELIELCELADVTPRTVRYYVQQGLLPSPGTRGPGARYDERHLDRLRLIRRLQREHLPLAEIRHQLAGLDDDAVRALVRESRESRDEPSERSALAYVRDVLAGTSGTRKPPARTASPGAAAPLMSAPMSVPDPTLHRPDSPHAADQRNERIAALAAGAALASTADDARERLGEGPMRFAPGGARSTWERIELAPDLELHVRRPLSRAQNKLVDRLIQQARTLFSEEP